MTLKDKICFVTGSSKGIGKETAKLFAQNGATVIITGKDEKKIFAVLDELNNISDNNHFAISGDISDMLFLKKTYRLIFEKYRRLDVLVNNAGILKDALIGMISTEMVDNIIAVNQKSVIYNLQFAARLMQRLKSGSIINVSSIVGSKGNAGQLIYSSTKAAIIGITYSASKELAKDNIRVNAVAPGLVNTDMIKSIAPDKMNKLKNSILLGRIAEPIDVAKTILFFASDYSTYVTGQVLGVDGGMII